MHQPAEIADYIIGLYRQHGAADYIGEPVSQLEHMCQCALLAESEGYEEEVILAAFFHDIGHFCAHIDEAQRMDQWGRIDHEQSGADLLRRLGFPAKIVSLVQNHVAAKRYLTAIDASYYDKLSEASKQTLKWQGGPMSEDEVRDFEADPYWDLHIKLRLWDDEAKQQDLQLPDLDIYREMIVRCLVTQT